MTREMQRNRLISGRSCFSIEDFSKEIQKSDLNSVDQEVALKIFEEYMFRDSWFRYNRASNKIKLVIQNAINRLLHGEDLRKGERLDA